MHSKPDTTVLVVATINGLCVSWRRENVKCNHGFLFYITHVKTADDFSNKSEQKEGEQVNCLFTLTTRQS